MAATRNEYTSHGDTFSQTFLGEEVLPGSFPRGQFCSASSSPEGNLCPRSSSTGSRFPNGEPPLQVSLHGASIPSLEEVFIPSSLATGLGGPATYHLRGSLFPGPLSRPTPLTSIPTTPFTRSLLPKTPQRTASIILGALLMPGIPSPEGNLCTLASPTEALP